MQSLAVNGYTEAEVMEKLHASGRQLAFKYELLDSNNVHKEWLVDQVSFARIVNNSLAEIERTAKFQINESANINYLRDRIRPWFRLRMRDSGDGQWAAWPMGIFLLSSPKRIVRPPQPIFRDVEAYDQSVILRDDATTSRYTVTAGTNVIAAVDTVLAGAGIPGRNLVATTRTVPVTREWKPGTPKSRIIADLLDSITYRSLYFNSAGFAVAQPYTLPDQRPTDYSYLNDDKSLLYPEGVRDSDIFDVPNKWIASVSEPDRSPLIAEYTNTNPASPTSTVNRGRTITRVIPPGEATDQAALNELVAKVAYEDSQVFERVEFNTALMPHHEDADILELRITGLTEKARYVEAGWEAELKAGFKMTHVCMKVVPI